jgi:hypothetical protein
MRYDATEFCQGVTEVLADGTAVTLARTLDGGGRTAEPGAAAGSGA